MSNYNDTSKLPVCDKHRHEIINHALREEVIPLTVGMKLEQAVETLRKDYNELIMAVACKFKNETRHETALRYINERENRVCSVSSRSTEASHD
jgi:isochorismate hydrolase